MSRLISEISMAVPCSTIGEAKTRQLARSTLYQPAHFSTHLRLFGLVININPISDFGHKVRLAKNRFGRIRFASLLPCELDNKTGSRQQNRPNLHFDRRTYELKRAGKELSLLSIVGKDY